jgi:hypothetical protein
VCKNYALHAGTGITFSAGVLIDGGVVGVSPASFSSITGLDAVIFQNGANYSSDSTAFGTDVVSAHSAAIAQQVNSTIYVGISVEIKDTTFMAGTHRFDGAISLATGFVTLDGQGDSSSKFLIQADTTLITGANTYVNLINGTKAENVLWALGSAATLGANSIIQGSILAGSSITFGNSSEVHGCALALAAVTFPGLASVYLPDTADGCTATTNSPT